jgi:hypothetical protein
MGSVQSEWGRLAENQTAVRERQTTVKERGIMKKIESLVRGWIPGALCVVVISLVAGVPRGRRAKSGRSSRRAIFIGEAA